MASLPQQSLDYKDLCVGLGCSTPGRRALVAAGVIGIVAYAIKQPDVAFDDDGRMRPLKGLSKDPSATCVHFLTLPLAAGVAAFAFS